MSDILFQRDDYVFDYRNQNPRNKHFMLGIPFLTYYLETE